MRLTIEKKLGLSFAVVFGLSIIVCCFSYLKLSTFSKVQDYTATVQLDIYTTAYDVRVANQQAGALLGEYVMLSGDTTDRDSIRRDWEQTWERLDRNIAKLQQVSYKRSENAQHAQELARLAPEFRRVQQQVLDAASRGSAGNKEATEIFKSQEVPRAAEIRKLATEMVNNVGEVMHAADEEVDTAANRTKWTLVVGTLVSIVLGSVLVVLVSRHIVKALDIVVARANAIAAGDLSGKAIEPSSSDEIADLTTAVNQMQAHLVEVLQGIEQNAQTVASASEEISANATQSAKGSQFQSDQTTQVATAVQQMSATVVEISDNSTRAADAARKAVDTAKRGGNVVEESLSNMRAIATSVVDTAKKIEELGKSSDQIGKIVAVIDDIADQTNLLALNAAIEAARAGDQGRGFAVVADEVRKLAERTTTATKEIAQMIETVQRETRMAVDHMNDGTKQVERGVQTTTQAGDSLLAIIQDAEQVGDMVAQIASAATEQASTTEQIRANVASIAKITQESAVGAQQSAKACEDLSQLAMDLQQLVAKFDLAGTRTAEPLNLARAPYQTRPRLQAPPSAARYSARESHTVQ